jgi:NitT/TauT family transport system permease protein
VRQLIIAPKFAYSRRFILKNFNRPQLSIKPESIHKNSLLETLAKNNSWLVFISILLVLVVWFLGVQWGKPPAYLLPTPVAVWEKFKIILSNGSLLFHASITFYEVLLGMFFGSMAATFLGYALAKSTVMEKLLSPYLVASQAIPMVAIAPLLVIWFGPGMFSKVLICALIVFFPVLVNTMIGFRAVPDNLHDLLRSMNATRWQKLRLLEIPSALPILFGGLRIGAALSVIGAVVGEFVGSNKGLGFLINVGRGQYDTPLVFVSIFTLILLALVLYGIAMAAEKRSTRWKSAHQ